MEVVGLYVASGILILTFVVIVFDLVHRTLAALLGASLMIFASHMLGMISPSYDFYDLNSAVEAIDFNTILLLMGMMLIVSVLNRTGFFQWTAAKAYKMAKGDAWRLVIYLSLITAVLSAFLDNVTTILLIAPVTIEIAMVLGLSPVPLLISEVLASNIGGTATLIGDPPNILIGSYANLAFIDFVINLAPIVVINLIALLFLMWIYFRKKLKEPRQNAMDASVIEKYKITDMRLFRYSAIVLVFVTVLFIIHDQIHMEPSVIALMGASVLLLISRLSIVEILEDVEWPTLIFFGGLFVIVGAAEHTGLITLLAEKVVELSAGNPTTAILLVLWVAVIASSIIDNIPFTATMLPIIPILQENLGIEGHVLWWALSLGACFGGNATLIGSSANVVAAGISERTGHPISFIEFLKVGAPVTLITVGLASVYVLLILA